MPTIVQKLLRIGTGPVRFRSNLRTGTQPMRRVAPALAAVERVSSPLPVSVLGDDLIRLMSGHLQRALSYTTDPEGPAHTPRVRRTFYDGSGFDAPMRALESTQMPRVAASGRSMWTPPKSVARVHESPSLELDRGQRRRAKERDLALGLSPRRMSQSVASENARTASRGRYTTPHGATLARQSRRDSASAPVLSAKLKEYWQLTRGDHIRRALTPAQSAATSAPASTARMVDELPTATSSGPEAQQTPGDVAQSLQRFFAPMGSEAERVAFRKHSLEPAPALPARGGALQEGRLSATAAAESSWDLADRIADILREQALQHGIDLS